MTKPSQAANKIREFREALGMPRQQDLADAVDVAVTAVSAWERGAYEPESGNYFALQTLALKRGLFEHAAWFQMRAGVTEEDGLVMAAHQLGITGVELERLRRARGKVEIESDIPAPPSILPPKWQEKWKEIYRKRLANALQDEPNADVAETRENKRRRHWLALRESNRLLRTPECTSYAEAAALEDWQVIKRIEEDGFLKVVTIDAKKYKFEVPKK